MPIQEYHCATCDRDVEVLLLTRNEQVACPDCGGQELSRVLSKLADRPRIPGAIKHGRRLAASEGHFSHYSAKEKSQV